MERRFRYVGVFDNNRLAWPAPGVDPELLLRERHQLSRDAFAELVVWRVPSPVRGCSHHQKYRLALVVRGECVLRYDNEAGKGDHRRYRQSEAPYRFESPARLIADFWNDVETWPA